MAGFGGGGPYDYSVDAPDISGSLLGGIQAGQQLGAARDTRIKAQQYADDLHSTLANPTPDAFAALIAKYPQQQKAFQASWGILNKDQQDQQFSAGTQAYSAIQNGKPDVAAGILDKQIAALKNSGQDTSNLEKIKEAVDRDPKGAGAQIALSLSSFDPDRWGKIATELRASQVAPAMAQKANAEAVKSTYEANNTPERLQLENSQSRASLRNIDSQIDERSRRLNLDRDKLQSDVELKLNELGQKATTLDDGAKKLINDSAIASVAADQTAGQFLDLAGQIEKLGGGYGAFGTAAEFLANATGNQDAMSAARREYVRLRNTQAIKNLPPGAASDADVAMALEGFPKETADSKTLSAFLRGTAKLSQIEATNENAKSEWVNAVGYLGKPKTDIEIDGVSVPKGTTFTDFAKKYVMTKTEQRGAEQSQQRVPTRSYMKYATPGGQ